MESILINHKYVLEGKDMQTVIEELKDTPQEIKDFLHKTNILTIKYKISNQYKIYAYWK